MRIGAYIEQILQEVVSEYAPKELYMIDTSIEITDQEANLNVVLIVGGTDGHPYAGRAVKFPEVLPDKKDLKEWAAQVILGAKNSWLSLKNEDTKMKTEHEE
jgi:hypothetical protein